MTAAPLSAHKVALAFDGGDAERMLARMTDASASRDHRALGPGALAASSGGRLPREGSFTVFTGVPVAEDPLPNPDSSAGAASELTRLEGAFAGFHWDDEAEILSVVSDPFGMAPLYWRRTSAGIALFTETKAVTGSPDVAAWGAFMTLGHTIGERTLVEGVERFPAATVMRYHARANRIELDTYWRWSDQAAGWTAADFVEAFSRNVRQYAGRHGAGTLLLSGGLDSRWILFLLRSVGVTPEARIVAHDEELGDADGRCALAAAASAGIVPELYRPDPRYFETPGFLEYVRAVDASFPTHGLFIAKLFPFIPDGAVWDGLIPGAILADNPHNPGGGFEPYRRREIPGLSHPLWQTAIQLFGRDCAESMYAGFIDDFRALRQHYPDTSEGVARFVFEQRARHRTAQNPLKAHAQRATPMLPGLTRDIVDAAMSRPYASKANGAMHLRLLRELDPRSLEAPILSGGQPIRRGAVDIAALRTRILSRVMRLRSRHPRLLGGPGQSGNDGIPPLPPGTTSAGRHDTDPWIRADALAGADPASAAGYDLWRLYFHWSVWRGLHGEGEAD